MRPISSLQEANRIIARLRRRLCCSSPTIVAAPEGAPDEAQKNTIQFDTATCSVWYINNQGEIVTVMENCAPAP